MRLCATRMRSSTPLFAHGFQLFIAKEPGRPAVRVFHAFRAAKELLLDLALDRGALGAMTEQPRKRGA